MIHPTLYKIDSKGVIRSWEVKASGSHLIVNHGILHGKRQRKSTECKPKNIGRANETTAEEQAIKEAEARWVKQITRECYVKNLSDPPAYIQPMLARDATKVGHQIDWRNEIYGQAKLDGVRVLHIPGKGLQSRKGIFYDMNHMDEPLCELREQLELQDNMWIDAEIFTMGMPLNRILGAARKTNSLTPSLCIHIFDIACEGQISYAERRNMLAKARNLHPNISVVPSFLLSKADIDLEHTRLVREGYEGLMIKDGAGHYGFGERSDTLFKYKKFREKEYFIVDVLEDKDGQGIIVYATGDGRTFKSRSRGTNEEREYQLDHKQEFIGKEGTVRFFDFTEYGIPQFPITVAIGQCK